METEKSRFQELHEYEEEIFRRFEVWRWTEELFTTEVREADHAEALKMQTELQKDEDCVELMHISDHYEACLETVRNKTNVKSRDVEGDS